MHSRCSTLAKIARSTGNWNWRSASSPSMTAGQPVSRHRRSKISGGPRRRLSITSPSPSRKADSTSVVSLRRAPDCRSWSSLPASSQSSDRPSVATTCCRTELPSRRLSTTNGLAAEEHAGLAGCTTPMHQTTASVNAFYARFLALHFRPIFAPRPPKTAEIRHFPSASAAKTVELQLSSGSRPLAAEPRRASSTACSPLCVSHPCD